MIHIFNFYIIHLHNLHLLFSNTRFQENVKCEIWKSQLVTQLDILIARMWMWSKSNKRGCPEQKLRNIRDFLHLKRLSEPSPSFLIHTRRFIHLQTVTRRPLWEGCGTGRARPGQGNSKMLSHLFDKLHWKTSRGKPGSEFGWEENLR